MAALGTLNKVSRKIVKTVLLSTYVPLMNTYKHRALVCGLRRRQVLAFVGLPNVRSGPHFAFQRVTPCGGRLFDSTTRQTCLTPSGSSMWRTAATS